MRILALLLACSPVTLDSKVETDPFSETGDGGTTPDTTPVDTGPTGTTPGDTADEVEDVPGLSDELFNETLIHEIGFEIDEESLKQLSRNPYDYAAATLVYGPLTYEVGIHVKGSSTYEDINSKPSLKVKVNWSVPDQQFMGHKKFNLHNMVLDPSMMSEELTYRFFREAGLPASRTGYAHLTVNGADYGLYSVVETVADEFLSDRFEDGNGNLYEDGSINGGQRCDLDRPSCFEAEEVDEGNDEALAALSEAALQSGEDWEPAVREQLRWDHFIGFMAEEMGVAHWDSYSYDLSNYRLYHDPSNGMFSIIVSSADLGFGYRPWSHPECGHHGENPSDYTMGMLALSCKQSPQCWSELLDQVEVVAQQIEDSDTTATIEAARARIVDAVYVDHRKSHSNADFEEHIECLTDFLADRPDTLRAWVASQR